MLYKDKNMKSAFWSEKLRGVMAEKNIGNHELAKAMGKSYHTIITWRRGHSVPSIKNLMKLGKALGVDYKVLLK
jgi:transcriptional regulator with XRE-family HTH domain